MDQEKKQAEQDGYEITDLPLEDIEKDALGVKKYILGIQEFICTCPAPMSIALQGDWGTGKTSFIKIMRKNLGGDGGKDVKTIYFNTWQYSQFDMSGDLYSSFLLSIMENLRKAGNVTESDIKEFLKSVAFVSLSAVTDCIPGKIGDSVKLLLKRSERYFEAEQERSKRVSELKQKFANLVEKTVPEGGKLVIFVDDLDRLSPETAVELLEVIKLFMDVERCVFVLAIDYDVVVRGVKKKFGNDMDDGKCRSFFDKIIQLTFRMPVENYQFEKMIKKRLEGKAKGYEKILGDFIRSSASANPRTLKRALNSFDLLSRVRENDKKDAEFGTMDNALFLMLLFTQMASPAAYDKLLEDGFVREDPDTGNEGEDDTKGREDAYAMLHVFRAAIQKIIKNSDRKENKESIGRRLAEISRLADIKSVQDDASASRGEAVKVDRIVVAGKEEAVSNATRAIVRTYEQLLSQYADAGKIREFMGKYKTILTTDGKWGKSTFRNKKLLDTGNFEGDLYLGCSTGFPVKAGQADALCAFLGLEDGCVRWFDGGEEVYCYTK